MCGICIAVAYADARHMFSISLFLSFLSEIRKKVITDLPIFISRSPTLYLGCSKPLSGGIIILT
ncbi:hypothetical protein CIC81_01345 [Shigella sonnei]|nr:hypothetical protein [Shigella sonnei]